MRTCVIALLGIYFWAGLAGAGQIVLKDPNTVYEWPGGQLLGKLYSGIAVDSISKRDDYLQVRAEGFVSSALLKFSESNSVAVTAISMNIALYDAPNGKAIGELLPFVRLGVISVEDSFAKVSVEGWVQANVASAYRSTLGKRKSLADSIWIKPNPLDEYGALYQHCDPYDRAWTPFHGNQRINEKQLFGLAGDEDLVKHASTYEQAKARGILSGILLSVAGDIMVGASTKKSGKDASGLIVSGIIVSGAGAFIFVKALMKPPRFAHYSAAREAAEYYNTETR